MKDWTMVARDRTRFKERIFCRHKEMLDKVNLSKYEKIEKLKIPIGSFPQNSFPKNLF